MRFPNPISQQTVLLQFVESGLYNSSDRICFRRKISDFFPKNESTWACPKNATTEVSLASLWWTTSRATRWWGLEAFGAPRGFPRPKKTGGGSLLQPLVMMMDHENLRCIHNTHQSNQIIKIWTKITMWFVRHHHCPLHLGLIRLSFGALFQPRGSGWWWVDWGLGPKIKSYLQGERGSWLGWIREKWIQQFKAWRFWVSIHCSNIVSGFLSKTILYFKPSYSW